MSEAKEALRTQPFDRAKTRTALEHLRQECQSFIAGLPQPVSRAKRRPRAEDGPERWRVK